MPRPVPFDLRGEKRLKDQATRCSPSPGPLSRNADLGQGSVAVVRDLLADDLDPHRIGAGRQGVFQQIAKDLHHAKTIQHQFQRLVVHRFAQFRIAALPLALQQTPRLAPDVAQSTRGRFQTDRGCEVADLVE